MTSNSRGAPLRSRDRNISLKKYYGVAESNETAPEPFNIDGDTFDKTKYLTALLKESSLNGLMRKDNELMSEIREIDGDMKTLVYENYNKFISATDTIRKMKPNVESMESEMRNLNENISNISKHCVDINQTLDPNREQMYQLTNKYDIMTQLQYIRQLPNQLNHFLMDDQYEEAKKHFSNASHIFEQYQHIPACKEIEKNCALIMEKVNTNVDDVSNPKVGK